MLVANYNGGSVAAFPVKEGGKLGEGGQLCSTHRFERAQTAPQKEPHAHSFNPDKRGQYAFAPDLGVDKIFIYKLEADKAVIEPNDPAFVSVAPASAPGTSRFIRTASTRTSSMNSKARSRRSRMTQITAS